MPIKKDDRTEINLASIEQFSDRASIRAFILKTWLAEPPHTKHRYFVETLASGKRVYLERPASLNKGCDFVVFVEDLILNKTNTNDRAPKHDYVIDDLKQKKAQFNDAQWKEVISAIQVIYDCGKAADAMARVRGIPSTGAPFDTLLMIIRWLFIEQDITYWANTGREMLHAEIGRL